MKATKEAPNGKKSLVSIYLDDAEREAMRAAAACLFVREANLYRFAVHHLLRRLAYLNDESTSGSDLLALFLGFYDELHGELGLNKHQLFNLLNSRHADPSPFIAMSDVELLLVPQPRLRARLQQFAEAQAFHHHDSRIWLERYLRAKYALPEHFHPALDDHMLIGEGPDLDTP